MAYKSPLQPDIQIEKHGSFQVVSALSSTSILCQVLVAMEHGVLQQRERINQPVKAHEYYSVVVATFCLCTLMLAKAATNCVLSATYTTQCAHELSYISRVYTWRPAPHMRVHAHQSRKILTQK